MKNVKYWKYFEINSMNIGIIDIFLGRPDLFVKNHGDSFQESKF